MGLFVRITEILKIKRPMFSLEFFPPKTEEGMSELLDTLREAKRLQPGFISVTYGAGGATRDKTIQIVKRAKREIGLESVAHLTCVGHSKQETKEILDEISSAGIESVVALRGDPPKGEARFVPDPDGFRYASELTAFIRHSYSLCVAVAGYPEGHIESPNKETDWKYLQKKVAAGADLIITNLFFNNEYFFDFERRMREMGVKVPIIPGIMPITNYNQILRFTRICGATIPHELVKTLESVQNDLVAIQRCGVEHAIEQCEGLLDHGVPGIHFYTLNKSKATSEIIRSLTH
jgi:methylenetetrahydrofolate reductase (NADPH)